MISDMRAPVFALALLAASAAAPALADTIYKWVDDQGTMHYSNNRPADASRHPEVLSEERVSTIQSEPAQIRAAAAARAESDYLARRIDDLERQVAAQRQAAYAAALQDQAMQAAYDNYAGPAFVYGAPVIGSRVATVRHHRVRPINRMNNFTGVTAGNLVTFGTARGPRR